MERRVLEQKKSIDLKRILNVGNLAEMRFSNSTPPWETSPTFKSRSNCNCDSSHLSAVQGKLTSFFFKAGQIDYICNGSDFHSNMFRSIYYCLFFFFF